MKKMRKFFSVLLVLMLTMAMLPVTASAATLSKGSRGTQVKYLQVNLNGLGYASMSVDGQFGSQTEKAVKKFQKAYGLSADGIAGSQTLGKMDSVVKDVQNKLNKLGYSAGSADGVYGNNTKNAVKKFQKAVGLTADGIAGTATLKKLNEATTPKPGNPSNNTNTVTAVTSGFSKTASNVKTYSVKKDGNKKITNNFVIREFACYDGSDTVKIDSKLAALLQDIRTHFGKPVTINSAYRTASHNARVGGASNSYHLYGKAADISVSGVSPREVAKYAESLGVKGIGLYDNQGFVHVDTRTSKYFWRNNGNNAVSTFR